MQVLGGLVGLLCCMLAGAGVVLLAERIGHGLAVLLQALRAELARPPTHLQTALPLTQVGATSRHLASLAGTDHGWRENAMSCCKVQGTTLETTLPAVLVPQQPPATEQDAVTAQSGAPSPLERLTSDGIASEEHGPIDKVLLSATPLHSDV